MQRLILAALVMLILGGRLSAQTAADPNAGLTLARDPSTGAYTLSWWATAGRTYFIQQSSDLLTWNFLPLMETAPDEVISWGFTTTADRLFLRLSSTDETFFNWENRNGFVPEGSTSGPAPDTLAPSGNGLTLLQCYQNGYSPFNWYAGKTPTLKIISGNFQYGTLSTQLPLPLVVEVRDQHNNLLINAPVVFSTTSGRGFPNDYAVRTGTDGRASTTFVTSPVVGEVSVVTAYANTDRLEAGVDFHVGNIQPPPPPPPPAPPGNVVVVQNPDGSMDMTWLYPADNTVSFDIQIRGTYGDWVTIGSVPANTASVHINPDHTIAQ